MRTRYTFYNFLVSLITSVILPIVGMLKIRMFIDVYGQALNGLQLTIVNVITFLNICEIAYSLAFRQLLFKPLANDDRASVLKIYYGARKIFKITGTLVIALGIIVAFFFPLFSDSPLNYGETVFMFIVFLLPYGLSYYLMGPNFVIIADQKEYKINIWIQTIAILRMVAMVVVIYLRMPYYVVFFIEGGQVLLANVVAYKVALKQYTWLNQKCDDHDRSFLHNAKYTIIQRLSTLATTNTDNIVIAMFMGYNAVSIFGNYSYLTNAVSKIIQSAITSPINSFGNLFNDAKSDAYSVFTEYFNFAVLIASIISICVFVAMPQFVFLWLRRPDEYLVTVPIALLFALNLFYMTMRETVIITRDSNGLFVDAKVNAYVQAIVKVILTIVLIIPFGFVGVLLATFLTNWVVDFLYNPVLVYRKVFHATPLKYYKMVGIRLLIAAGITVVAYIGWQPFGEFAQSGFVPFLICCVGLGSFVLISAVVVYAICFKSFRNLFVRMRLLLFKR